MTGDTARRRKGRAWPILSWAPGYQRSYLLTLAVGARASDACWVSTNRV